ncbi:MAG: 2-oxo acid dehydrogenase subunit E2 [Deltaproteobacteria bacterium]|nr:2-oxo acid dehydrogenase subunit E2 [Deltaproteobacteria bacterium]
MATVVALPRLSDTMEEGVIAKWHIKPGDKVKRGQMIAEIETDKATMEFESFDAGVVLELVAPEGKTLPIGAPIAVFGQAGEDPKAALSGAAKAPAKAESKPTAKTDAAPESKHAAKPDAEPAAKTDAAPAAKPDAAPASSTDARPDAKPEPRDDGRIAASPLARRLARERGLALADIEGSGPHGRVVKTDVERAASAPRAAAAAAPASAGDTVVELSMMRKTIAKRMAQANAEIPHFYLTIVVDMDRAAAVRDELAAADVKVSYNDLIVLACAKALRIHPEVNAYWNGQTIVRRGDVHVGIAVAVEDGLVVPVLRHTDRMSLSEIAASARTLGGKARERALEPAQMTGSTFSVSNLGMFGIEAFAAVVNPGEGAILAVGGIADEAVVRAPAAGGAPTLAVGKRMRVTLSCDHRVMDGATGAKFLATVRGLLEQPLRMLA